MSNHWPRTKTEALRDVDYLIRISNVHARLFGRLALHGRLIELIGGSAALVGVLGHHTTLLAVAGLVVAAVAYANVAFDFSASAQAHRAIGRRYAQLRAGAASLELDEIDRRRHRIGATAPSYIEALRVPCYNEVLRQHGQEQYQQPLTCWQRCVQAIA